MEKKNYVRIFILCCILIEGMGHFSKENNTEESSSFHVRRKRLINGRPVSIEQVPYVVSIKKDGNHICGGSILEPHVILTAAHCVEKYANYNILSGSSHLKNGIYHKVIKIIKHPDYHPSTYSDDLALLTIYPNIDLEHSPNRRISLFTGNLSMNASGTISGWGCIKESRWSWFRNTPPVFPLELQSIDVPIISLNQCRQAYKGDPDITENVVCTFDTIKYKQCGLADSGNPLVVNGQLLGVMAWHQIPCCFSTAPDVFMNLSQPKYRIWILSNIPHNQNHPNIRSKTRRRPITPIKQ